MTWTLSGFADEIDQDLEVQISTLASESMRHLELRSVWGTNVAELGGTQLTRLHSRLDDAGISVSAIGSPIGKVPIEADLGPELERLRRVMGVADALGTGIVRVFSFFIPRGRDAGEFRGRVLDGMKAFADLAEEHGLVLAHENEKEIYGDIPSRCVDIVESIGSPALRSTFDAANFVQCGIRPHSEGYEALRPHLVYMQIKDALFVDGAVVPAGEGDGEIRETLRALAGSGFDGYFSLEPHLTEAGRFGGFSGPERFRQAVQALKRLLGELGVPWC